MDKTEKDSLKKWFTKEQFNKVMPTDTEPAKLTKITMSEEIVEILQAVLSLIYDLPEKPLKETGVDD